MPMVSWQLLYKGEVTDGKVFTLDVDQQNTIEDLAKVITITELML